MIETLIRIRDRVKITSAKLDDLLIETLQENELFINELIRMQLQQGFRGDGQIITPTYSESYAKKKGFSIPNLKVTGKFYNDIKSEINKNFIITDANTKVKSFNLGQHLQKRYTVKILELMPKSLNKLKEHIIPKLINKIYNEIYG